MAEKPTIRTIVPAQAATQAQRSAPDPRPPAGRVPATLSPRQRWSATRRTLLASAAAVSGLLFGSAAVAQVKPAAPAAGPAWNQLSPQQREALAPLAGDWAGMPAENKRKWLEIATKYPQLSPEGKAKMQSRMAEFARLTPEQRRTTRENFQRAYELPLENRESAVQQFQLLPEEKKKQLTEQRNPRKDVPRPADAKK